LQRMQTLATAVVNRQQAAIAVSDEDSQKRYDADRDKKYQQAKIRAVFIQFADPKAINAQVDMADPNAPKVSIPKGQRVESEAKTIAEDVAKQARAGGDFAALAKEKSDDKKTGANGGEFPMLHPSDRIPEDLKKAIFTLKPGEVSDPVRAPNGFYVFKVTERGIQPFDEVKQAVANDVKTERFQKWMTDQQKQFEVTVESPAFFGAPSLQSPHGAATPQRPLAATPAATPAK
jgi:peptidyl-prolyl cis-trans isomerase C